MAVDHREQHDRAGAIAVGIVIEIAGGAVVDDPLILVGRRGADVERGPGERSGRELAEDRVVERDLVGARDEAADMIDIAGAQSGGEGESIGAGEPDQRAVAAFAVEDVRAPAGSLIPCESSGPD
jgi:hypothetical protein